MGPKLPENDARVVARQWLDRYSVVFREWWKRERPPVGWRAIYRELKRMELRGEVRRGYFVSGLSGAQFALPEAVERLRVSGSADEIEPLFVLATSDPSDAYTLSVLRDNSPGATPHWHGVLVVIRKGKVLAILEGQGRRLTYLDAAEARVRSAVRGLLHQISGG